MRRQDIDRDRQMIYVAETLTRYGTTMEGLKQTHHVAPREKRGRWMLFPAVLNEMLSERPSHVSGLLFPSPRGRPWGVRNFYRYVWEPARKRAGVDFTLYDLATRSLPAFSPQGFRWLKWPPGWATACGPVALRSTIRRAACTPTRPASGARSPCASSPRS